MRLIPVHDITSNGKTTRRHIMINEVRRKTFSGGGRARPPTREGVSRYPGGQIKHAERGESAEAVMSVAITARVQHLGVDRKTAEDKRLGTALGRLMLAGAVSPGQHAAGTRVASVMYKAAILDDVPPPYGTPVLARMSMASGRDPYEAYDPELAWDITDAKRRQEAIMKVRSDYAELTREVWEMESRPDTKGAWAIIQRVCLWDDAFAANGDAASGLLRCGLNKLVHLWQIRDSA